MLPANPNNVASNSPRKALKSGVLENTAFKSIFGVLESIEEVIKK
jgi:hypothetical protein